MGEQWLELLIENIRYQLRHPHYDRAIEIAKFSRCASTGKEQDEYVKRYRRFEDKDLQDQRVRLFNSPTKSAISRPRKYFKKLGRVEGVIRSLEVPAGQEDRMKSLQRQFQNFVNGKDVETWILETLEHLGVTDPNAWIVYERLDSTVAGVTMEPKVWPFIFSSADAVNYSLSASGGVEWLLGRTIIIEKIISDGVVKDNVLENYYLYAPGFIVRARERGEKTVQEQSETLAFIDVYATVGQPKKREFYISIFQNGTTEVPALYCGAFKDEESSSPAVCVPWFYPAEHVIHDLIRNKSLCDTLSVIYAYPKTYEFEAECDATECEKGFIGGNQETPCNKCKGSGVLSGFTTEQAKVRLRIPKEVTDPAALFDLSKLSYTEPVDISLLTFLEQKVDNAEARIMAAVFDSGLYQKPNGTETVTATEIDSIMEGISDVLTPYGNLVSLHYELAHRVGGQYLGISVNVSHNFPDQLDIQSLSDEVAAFDAMQKSGVGFEAIQAQQRRVWAKLYEGRPSELLNLDAKYQHMPFAGKSKEEIAMITAARAPLDRDRVLWENFEAIFQEIFQAYKDFALFAFVRQREIVDQKIEEYKTRVMLMDSNLPAMEPNFNANSGGTNQPANPGGV